MKQLIYAVYGSNLLEKRFMVYINGGEYRGKKYEGCRDKTKPEWLGWIYVPYRLYFAKKSERWDNGGVAFLCCEKEPDSKYHTIVRLWKISEEQFEDIHEQEGKDWYNNVLFLGKIGELEIKTITGCWKDELNAPCLDYLDVMKKGLEEIMKWSDEEIENYLKKFFDII